MSSQENLPEKVATNNSIEKSDLVQREYVTEKNNSQKAQDQSSIQKSMQDLDQDQHVETNPSQFNFQNVQLTLDNDMSKFAGKITGVVYSKNNREIIPNAIILLYFGSYDDSRSYAVCQTKSDDNGNFVLDGLPPGYYTLYAYLGRYLREKIHNIKMLPGQNHHQSILLKKVEDNFH
ncbi:MAG: carboxypeptidase-like regulatory domain-containing protein [Anaeromicrobium sp.]|jgi:hypothetical protein|uniref:carboxypeptidase-like regulatory domain-containing protein n=1 Tax=Anaeromicrobium sp. TaxID=1929132 RepID=UPI0025D2EAC0|nr:carboxypeptidase-like regulatory domain-containing protein [Anaeromicrobium sp.]MCT4594821.1 carboxypeptidase-like regulatory domain-containing protein [Anaeromicrobium sp.]